MSTRDDLIAIAARALRDSFFPDDADRVVRGNWDNRAAAVIDALGIEPTGDKRLLRTIDAGFGKRRNEFYDLFRIRALEGDPTPPT